MPSAGHGQALAETCINITFETLPDVSTSQLSDALAHSRVAGAPLSALHILCHGSERDGAFKLSWNGAAQEPAYVSPAQLRQLLAPYADELRLVTLCACDSSNAGAPGNHLGSLAQALHRVGIPWVIGSRYPLSKSGSVAFTEVFYRHLLIEGAPIPAAFRAAQTHLPTLDDGGREWMSLQLYASADTRARLTTAHEHRLFVAYHRRDQPLAESLAHRLRERDIEPWLDSWNLIPGDFYQGSAVRG